MLNINFNEQYITDADGQRVAVILEMAVYRKILEALEDLEDAALFDAALADSGDSVPFDQAVSDIERDRPAA